MTNPCQGHAAESARAEHMIRIGKKAAGRLLDGRTHDGFPETRL